MVQESFTPPETVVKFEKLMVTSLGLGILNVVIVLPMAIQHGASVSSIGLRPTIRFAILLCLVLLASRKQKNFPRWTLLALFVLNSLVAIPLIFSMRMHDFVNLYRLYFLQTGISMAGTMIEILALYFVFAPLSQPWFHRNDTAPPSP